MKDKHINIAKDSYLLKQVYNEVEKKLKVDKKATTTLLIVKFVFYFSLVVLTYSAIYFSEHASMVFTAYILFGLLSVLLGFNFAHDFCHNTIFKNKKLNNFGFTFIYTLLGAHAGAWKFRHIHSHHYAPNVKDYDTDLEITNLIRVEPTSPHKWFHKYQQFYAPFAYSTYSFYWVFVKDFVVYFTDNENPHNKKIQFHLSFWLQKLFYISYLLILPILFSNSSWLTVLSAFVVMHLIQSLFLLFTFFMTHHVEQTEYFNADMDGYIQASWFTNQIKSSNDFHPFSQTANFIFGGFNNHVAHHLFPHINHVHYPALNKILYKILKQYNIKPNTTTFFGGIVSHLKHLKTMSMQP